LVLLSYCSVLQWFLTDKEWDLVVDWSHCELTNTMASKRVEKAMHMRQVSMPSDGGVMPHVQINSSVDTQKSIEELINAGVDPKKDPKFKRKASNTARGGGLPPSFNHRPLSKSRGGSSAGHSREGSSDDGIGSGGRNTLSPASVGDHQFSYGGGHQRIVSAPELLHAQYADQMKPLGSQMAPPFGLHTHSKSLGGMLPAHPMHQKAAKSWDADAHLDEGVGRHLEVAYTDDGREYFIE
jgi:hypothetical protein